MDTDGYGYGDGSCSGDGYGGGIRKINYSHKSTHCYSCGEPFPAPTLKDFSWKAKKRGTKEFTYMSICKPECNRYTPGTALLTKAQVKRLRKKEAHDRRKENREDRKIEQRQKAHDQKFKRMNPTLKPRKGEHNLRSPNCVLYI